MQERFTGRPAPPLASRSENGPVVGLTRGRASPGQNTSSFIIIALLPSSIYRPSFHCVTLALSALYVGVARLRCWHATYEARLASRSARRP